MVRKSVEPKGSCGFDSRSGYKFLIKMMINKFQIRYNTKSESEHDRWRLIENNREILVSDVIVNGNTYTTKDWMPEIQDYKYHITCEGSCVIKNNVAYITTTKEKLVLTRHLLKTISYRLFGTLITISIAYFMGVPLAISSLIGVGELLIKPAFYFVHERFWYKFISIGRR